MRLLILNFKGLYAKVRMPVRRDRESAQIIKDISTASVRLSASLDIVVGCKRIAGNPIRQELSSGRSVDGQDIGSGEVRMVWVEGLESLAAVCTTLCWVPQAVKILREKRTEGISLLTQILFTFGVALWTIYGILLINWPILLANAVTLVFSLAILVLKVRYR